jgi:periplasmic divalent cation tolerance protein
LSEPIQVLTTTASKEDAERIAQVLLERRLAACVQIDGPIISKYWWQQKIETSEEWRCLIKSRRDLYADLEAAIGEFHPYDVPEILAIPVLDGSAAYLGWLQTELKPVGPSE